MSIKNQYRHYDLSFHKQQVLAVSKFLGVDFNPAQLEVADYHATDIENIIYKDKVNQKRSGWEQLAAITATTYHVQKDDGTYEEKTNTVHFNGLFKVLGTDGRQYIIAHIGHLLYAVSGLGKSKNFLDVSFIPLLEKVYVGVDTEYDVAVELEDRKSSYFHGYKRGFILDGNTMYVIKINANSFEIRAVEDDSETYIPVTTTGITYADSAVNSRVALDDVNLMTQYRRNKLISGTYLDDGVSLRTTRFWDWQLDTSVKTKNPTDINNIRIQINSLKEIN